MRFMHTISRALLGSLALVLASFGTAEAADAGAEAASAADQLPADQEVSQTVIDLAGWVVATRDSEGYPFAIIDKRAAQILVFDGDGRLRGAAPVLLGSAVGDRTAPGITGYALRDIPGHARTTPAGRFIGGFGPSIDAGRVLWVDYDSAVSIHAIPPNIPGERREERLASPEPTDNRITHGCINVSAEFYDESCAGRSDAAGCSTSCRIEPRR